MNSAPNPADTGAKLTQKSGTVQLLITETRSKSRGMNVVDAAFPGDTSRADVELRGGAPLT